MSEEEQEIFQDALELERYIEQLRLQRSARPPANLTAEQLPIYSMAAFFHTASAEVANPRPGFGVQLYQRLLQQAQAEDNGSAPFQADTETMGLQEIQQPTNLSDARKETAGAGLPPVTTSTIPFQGQQRIRRIYSGGSQPASTDEKKPKRRAVSRRALLGGSIAASLLAGAGLGAAIGHTLEPQPGLQPPDLHPTIRGDAWHPVASVEQLGEKPIRFSTNTITGYLIRQTGNGNEAVADPVLTATSPAEPIIAFSAACTHLGCLVQWQDTARQFPCPCHGRTFDAAGNPVYSEDSQPHYMSLPRMETKIEDGNIYVKVPT